MIERRQVRLGRGGKELRDIGGGIGLVPVFHTLLTIYMINYLLIIMMFLSFQYCFLL
jgi:hypothetical protein